MQPKMKIRVQQPKAAVKVEEKPKQPAVVTTATSAVEKKPNQLQQQQQQEMIVVEKNTGMRLVKPMFRTEAEMSSRLACGGRFYKLRQLKSSVKYLKEVGNEWYTVVLIGSRTEPKCSARGNKYVIWHVYDLDTLENDNDEVSLFLFGAAYSAYWKTSEFEVYAVLKPDFLDDESTTAKQPTSSSASSSKKSGGNFSNRLSICVRNEAQLIKLGCIKDVSRCQYVARAGETSMDQAKSCRKLVNSLRAPFCIYHCMKNKKSFSS